MPLFFPVLRIPTRVQFVCRPVKFSDKCQPDEPGASKWIDAHMEAGFLSLPLTICDYILQDTVVW